MLVTETDTLEFEKWSFQIRVGSSRHKVLAEGELAPGEAFWFLLMRYGSDGVPYETPRHRHTFEQVRFTVQGAHNYAPKKNLKTGTLAYFPAGAYYGPQHDEDSTVLYLQFGKGFITARQYEEAFAELSKVGTFKDGVYTTVDPETGKKHNKDGSQAAFEYIHKDPLVFPEPRYPQPIEINPAAFEWSANGGGLERKFLAKLTEHEVSLSMLRWNASSPAELAAGSSDFVFSLTDGLCAEDRIRPAQTAVWSPPEEVLELDGEAGTEALHISVPSRN